VAQSSYHLYASRSIEKGGVNGHARPALVTITQGYRYLGHRDNRWLSTSGDVPIRVVILCSVYAVPWVSWCDAVERRGTVLVVWIFFTSTIACLGVISTPDRSRSTHFEIVSGNACFGQLSTEMFSFITSSASCSRSRRTSGRNQPSNKDLGGIDESIDLSRDR
jgi:hypothetical protein